MKKIVNYLKSISVTKFMLAFATMFFVLTEPSLAQDFSSLGTFFTNISGLITGPVGTGIATIGMIAVGVTFMSGRMDWQFALAIVFGIAIIFAAATIGGTFVTP